MADDDDDALIKVDSGPRSNPYFIDDGDDDNSVPAVEPDTAVSTSHQQSEGVTAKPPNLTVQEQTVPKPDSASTGHIKVHSSERPVPSDAITPGKLTAKTGHGSPSPFPIAPDQTSGYDAEVEDDEQTPATHKVIEQLGGSVAATTNRAGKAPSWSSLSSEIDQGSPIPSLSGLVSTNLTPVSRDSRAPGTKHDRRYSGSLSLSKPVHHPIDEPTEVGESSPRLGASLSTPQAYSSPYIVKTPSKRTESVSEDSLLRSFERHRTSKNRVIMSSDDEAGRGTDSDVSHYDPTSANKPKKKYDRRPGARADSVSDDMAGLTNSASKTKVKAKAAGKSKVASASKRSRVLPITSSSRTFMNLPLPATKEKLSHVDSKLLAAKEEGRAWHDLAKMYTRITKIGPIADKDIEDRWCRIQARIHEFTVEEDSLIGDTKVEVEAMFEKTKWLSIAKAWSNRCGRKVGHRVLRERFIWLGQVGATEDAEVLAGDVENAIEEGLDGPVGQRSDNEGGSVVGTEDDDGGIRSAGPAKKKVKLAAGRAAEVHRAQVTTPSPSAKSTGTPTRAMSTYVKKTNGAANGHKSRLVSQTSRRIVDEDSEDELDRLTAERHAAANMDED